MTQGQLPDAGRVLQEGITAADRMLVTRASETLTEGYTTAFLVGAAVLVMPAVVVLGAVDTQGTQRAAH